VGENVFWELKNPFLYVKKIHAPFLKKECMLRTLGRGREEPKAENTEIYRLRPKKC